ncbi:hypothetical protein [uncultured Sphingomonas sp.]|uniref:hypothetical protein n=1 Tax=uncultured Sphingomonas sp. TaxID=158754 RepID=UPI003748C457
MIAAERAAARWRRRVAAHLASVPGLRAEETADGVTVSGRRLRARWLGDARLRDLRDGL